MMMMMQDEGFGCQVSRLKFAQGFQNRQTPDQTSGFEFQALVLDFPKGFYSPEMRVYRGTSLIRKRSPLGPYRRPMPRVVGES